MWRRSLLLILWTLASSCAPLQAPTVPEKPPADIYMIPLTAKNTDYVCAETAANVIHNYCFSVREFRLAVIPSLKADP